MSVPKRERERRPHLNKEKAKEIRTEYITNTLATIEYLADKFNVSVGSIDKILRNVSHHDPTYEKPQRKVGGKKKGVFIPEHLKEARERLVPPTTAHRARGQNCVINKFS